MKISKMAVKNFRSLRDVTIEDMPDVVTFIGMNDTGKSNILAFLDILFREKMAEEITDVSKSDEFPEGRKSEKISTGFWEGEIENFSNNFYKNTSEPISFDIDIDIERERVLASPSLPKDFEDILDKRKKSYSINLMGYISKISLNRARMDLKKVTLDEKAFYDGERNGIERYLPGFDDLDPSQRAEAFQSFMQNLNSAFLLIPANRFIGEERELHRGNYVELSASQFKNWLFSLSLDASNQAIFREIQDRFREEPFSSGLVTLARIQNEYIEILVEDEHKLKIPIDRKGSGIQQLLILLSYIIQLNSPFVGIEELEMNLSYNSQIALSKTLGEFLNAKDSPLTQLFLTTHSPLLAQIYISNRIFVDLDENGDTITKPGNDPKVEKFLFGA